MNGSLPLITVNMLTYNNFSHIEEALKSLFSQTYPHIELIISDDGSANFDLEYIEGLCSARPENIKNLKIIHHENNLGIVKNFKNGIKASNGEYFITLSSDDVFYNDDVISNVVDFFIKTGADIVTGKRAVYDNEMNNKIEILPQEKDIEYHSSREEFLYQRLCFSNYISGSATSYSKKLFDKHAVFDERYRLLEDYPLYLKLAREKEKIHFYNDIVIKYRLGGVSTSKTVSPVIQVDSLNSIKYGILPFLAEENMDLYKWKAFEYDYGINNRRLSMGLVSKYPKQVFLKIMNKIKLMNIDAEYFIPDGDNID